MTLSCLVNQSCDTTEQAVALTRCTTVNRREGTYRRASATLLGRGAQSKFAIRGENGRKYNYGKEGRRGRRPPV